MRQHTQEYFSLYYLTEMQEIADFKNYLFKTNLHCIPLGNFITDFASLVITILSYFNFGDSKHFPYKKKKKGYKNKKDSRYKILQIFFTDKKNTKFFFIYLGYNESLFYSENRIKFEPNRKLLDINLIFTN